MNQVEELKDEEPKYTMEEWFDVMRPLIKAIGNTSKPTMAPIISRTPSLHQQGLSESMGSLSGTNSLSGTSSLFAITKALSDSKPKKMISRRGSLTSLMLADDVDTIIAKVRHRSSTVANSLPSSLS